MHVVYLEDVTRGQEQVRGWGEEVRPGWQLTQEAWMSRLPLRDVDLLPLRAVDSLLLWAVDSLLLWAMDSLLLWAVDSLPLRAVDSLLLGLWGDGVEHAASELSSQKALRCGAFTHQFLSEGRSQQAYSSIQWKPAGRELKLLVGGDQGGASIPATVGECVNLQARKLRHIPH